jgi:uncharacterized protein YijF (DUF1287 family)
MDQNLDWLRNPNIDESYRLQLEMMVQHLKGRIRNKLSDVAGVEKAIEVAIEGEPLVVAVAYCCGDVHDYPNVCSVVIAPVNCMLVTLYSLSL